jgi:hypothetical protein
VGWICGDYLFWGINMDNTRKNVAIGDFLDEVS